MMKISTNRIFQSVARSETFPRQNLQIKFANLTRSYCFSSLKCKKREEPAENHNSSKVLVYEGAFAKRIISLRRISAASSLLTIPLIVSQLSFNSV
jgi:hypothetical protein